VDSEYYIKIFSSQIIADKTVKITINSQVETDKFVSNSMMSYANFVIETCPNLTTLHFDVYTRNMCYGLNAKDCVDKLHTILSSFMDEFLKPLDKGHAELKICLTWTGCEESSGYEVSKEWKWDDVFQI
jgi:hypothetical protein